MPDLPDVMPNPDTFKAMKRVIFRALRRAIESVGLGNYYANFDLTIQVRGKRVKRFDLREIEQVTE